MQNSVTGNDVEKYQIWGTNKLSYAAMNAYAIEYQKDNTTTGLVLAQTVYTLASRDVH